jgi:hypothetical protein
MKAVVGIMEHWHKVNPKTGEVVDEGSRLIEKREMDLTVDELHRKKGWRHELNAEVSKAGKKVLAVNVLAERQHGCDVVVTVEGSGLNRPATRKPVTRGKRRVDEPVEKKKTMAAKRRARR